MNMTRHPLPLSAWGADAVRIEARHHDPHAAYTPTTRKPLRHPSPDEDTDAYEADTVRVVEHVEYAGMANPYRDAWMASLGDWIAAGFGVMFGVALVCAFVLTS